MTNEADSLSIRLPNCSTSFSGNNVPATASNIAIPVNPVNTLIPTVRASGSIFPITLMTNANIPKALAIFSNIFANDVKSDIFPLAIECSIATIKRPIIATIDTSPFIPCLN